MLHQAQQGNKKDPKHAEVRLRKVTTKGKNEASTSHGIFYRKKQVDISTNKHRRHAHAQVHKVLPVKHHALQRNTDKTSFYFRQRGIVLDGNKYSQSCDSYQNVVGKKISKGKSSHHNTVGPTKLHKDKEHLSPRLCGSQAIQKYKAETKTHLHHFLPG